MLTHMRSTTVHRHHDFLCSIGTSTLVGLLYQYHDVMQESYSSASTTGQRAVIPPCPRRNQTTSTSGDRGLPPDGLLQRAKVNKTSSACLALPSFRLVSFLLFFPDTWSVFISLRSDSSAAPSRISDIFLPTEMGKQKERMVYKKIVFRSSIVPRNSIP